MHGVESELIYLFFFQTPRISANSNRYLDGASPQTARISAIDVVFYTVMRTNSTNTHTSLRRLCTFDAQPFVPGEPTTAVWFVSSLLPSSLSLLHGRGWTYVYVLTAHGKGWG